MSYGEFVLVTGASSGIGLAAARFFAERGCTVYAMSRHCKEETVRTGDGCIVSVCGDVTDSASLERVFSKIEKLNVVIHCAGFGISGSAECTPVDAVRAQMETNYIGVLNVNSFALPLLRKNSHSVVIITSSVAGIIPIPFQSHYSSSKYAIEAYGEALRMECRPYGVKVCLVEPGDTKTGFTAARTHNEPENSPYFAKCTEAVQKMAEDEMKGASPEKVASVFWKQAHKRNPKVRVAVGVQYKILAFISRICPSKLKQLILSKLY
ncbi:MAG: SDR family oxidoreductase [Sphaerochaetaceae bacterium]|nr:SDR family oxidoreductase [Sphaerochaetaceae bacterium]